MKTVLLACLLAAWWPASAEAQDQTYADCLVKTSASWGQPCDKCEDYKGYRRDYSGVYQVVLQNACTEMMEVKVAVEEADGQWRTFPVKALEGGASMSVYACHGTGKYMYWARRVNDTAIILPTDRDIVSAYPGR